ncbi:hypothetical protein A6A06_17530 [Streptomyces sp. CB02923]|uniref:hypothetical protein n=1 Tax=Streptomyces sp. CB02923 TaxID=1718985 RepID=UPI00093BE35B|nr:hypothetical protein [Streptomyces sp. CB02923]OKI00741.1 hypothetical protein A6A06_17530 [Streptomyces sp. CB02923]
MPRWKHRALWQPPSERATDLLAPVLLRRLLDGRPLQPRWLPRPQLTVLSGDLDPAAGVAALQHVWRHRSARSVSCTSLFERCGDRWRWTGGGGTRPADPLPGRRLRAGEPGQTGMVEILGSTTTLSRAGRAALDVPVPPCPAPMIGALELQVAAEVDHLLFGDRRVGVPSPGFLVVVWRFPPPAGPAPPAGALSGSATWPPIRCLAADGSLLSELAPLDSLDSYTWQRIADEDTRSPGRPAGTEE